MTTVSTVKLSKDIRKIVISALKDHNAKIVSGVTVSKAAYKGGAIALNVLCDRIAVKFALAKPAPTLREKTRARVKKALKAVATRSRRKKVVEGTRFIDPKTKTAYAAGSKEGRGWLCTGVKKTWLVDTFTEGVILKNLTPFQPKRAR